MTLFVEREGKVEHLYKNIVSHSSAVMLSYHHHFIV